ncbi:hypothetical protein [Lysobacter gummosus]
MRGRVRVSSTLEVPMKSPFGRFAAFHSRGFQSCPASLPAARAV